MAKATRFAWQRNAKDQTLVKTDKETEATIDIQMSDYPEEIINECTVYGMSKILDDRNSQVLADEKMDATESLLTQFAAGIWIGERTSGLRQVSPVIEVIMDAKGCTVSQAQKAWAGLDAESKELFKDKNSKAIETVVENRKADEDDEIALDDLLK